MSAQSMTGFGEANVHSENYIVSVEIKSVNNRFKDVRFKMPSSLSALEIELKKELNEFFRVVHLMFISTSNVRKIKIDSMI